jgi:F0F1-type ATP synthase membrane subunit a
MFLELLVAVVQALVFCMLTVVYLAGAVGVSEEREASHGSG